jgi:hypothetical protein
LNAESHKSLKIQAAEHLISGAGSAGPHEGTCLDAWEAGAPYGTEGRASGATWGRDSGKMARPQAVMDRNLGFILSARGSI